VTIGRILEEGGASLRGVMTHAGESYSARSIAELEAFAEQERLAVVTAAQHLRAAGLPCPVISVGSTPTAHFARNLDGVTEVRAGVFTFFDLVMAGIGVCTLDDLALSVLTTVIGHQADKGWVLCDAGWMALSRDRGTQGQAVDQGYGVVCDADGRPYDNLIVEAANQEHGIIALRPGSVEPLPDLPVGTCSVSCPTMPARRGRSSTLTPFCPLTVARWPYGRDFAVGREAQPMKFISEEQSAALISHDLAFLAAREALIAAVTQEATVFPAVAAHGSDPQNRFSIKSGATAEVAGLKVGSYWPGNSQAGLPRHNSTIMLFDQTVGRIAWVIEAGQVNAYRTAAADAVAADALARADASTLTVFGAGHQALYECLAVARVRPIRRVLVVARDTVKAEAFAVKLRTHGLTAEVAEGAGGLRAGRYHRDRHAVARTLVRSRVGAPRHTCRQHGVGCGGQAGIAACLVRARIPVLRSARAGGQPG
jgi:hypothetical protein